MKSFNRFNHFLSPRKLILSIAMVLGVSQMANASYMTPYELERAKKCSKDACFGNDQGLTFRFFCDASLPEMFPGTIAVYGPIGNCYCPCTDEYLAGARRP